MRLIAVTTTLNEADIIGRSLAHLYGSGVDEVHMALGPSTDGTREIVEQFPVKITDDDSDIQLQPYWMNRLIAEACEPGDWVLPVDADEFWYATDRSRLKNALAAQPEWLRKLHVRVYRHLDWDRREIVNQPISKVAFRYEPGCVVTNGNHDVSLPSGAQAVPNVVDLREWQFRSYEHLVHKCRERVARIDPTLPETDGYHQRELAVLTDEELLARWARMQSVPFVEDPIPYSG